MPSRATRPGRRPRERELADRLHSAAIHLLRRARRGDPLTGATPSQLSALSMLMSGPKTLGDLVSAELLLAYGADPNASDPKGHTPLDIARDRRNIEVAALLHRAVTDRGRT